MTCEWYLFECPGCGARSIGRPTIMEPVDDFARCGRCREIYPALGESVPLVHYASGEELERAVATKSYTNETEAALRLAVWHARKHARLVAMARGRLEASVNATFAIALSIVGGALLVRGAPWFALWELSLGAMFAWLTFRPAPRRRRAQAIPYETMESYRALVRS